MTRRLRWMVRGRCRATILTVNPGGRTYHKQVCHRVRFHRGGCVS